MHAAPTHPAAVPPDADKEVPEGEGVQLVGHQLRARGIGVELRQDHQGLLGHNLKQKERKAMHTAHVMMRSDGLCRSVTCTV